MSALPNLLSRRGARNFPSTSITLEDKKNACVIHPKVYSKAVKEDIKAFKKKERKETKKKLKEAYYTLVEGMKEEFMPSIKQICIEKHSAWSVKDSDASLIRLNAFIEHDVAMSYLNEVKLNASFLLNLKSKYGRRSGGDFLYLNAFDGRPAEYLHEDCIVDTKNNVYLALAKGRQKYPKSITSSRTDITALTLFSLYFSGKHTEALQGEYKDAAEAFHYNLKKLSAHPEFDDKVQNDVSTLYHTYP